MLQAHTLQHRFFNISIMDEMLHYVFVHQAQKRITERITGQLYFSSVILDLSVTWNASVLLSEDMWVTLIVTVIFGYAQYKFHNTRGERLTNDYKRGHNASQLKEHRRSWGYIRLTLPVLPRLPCVYVCYQISGDVMKKNHHKSSGPQSLKRRD